MDASRKQEILKRHYLKCAANYVERFTTIRLIDFEANESVWIERFYKAFEKVNSFSAVPSFTRPCGACSHEDIMWASNCLPFLQSEKYYLMPVKLHGCLANVKIDCMLDTLEEVWEPGLNFTVANKAMKKLIHIFEAEYEYQLYTVDM